MTNAYVLPSVYQEFIALSRYARFDNEKGRRETWTETLERWKGFWMKQRPEVGEETLCKLTDFIGQLKVMPSMRTLMTAGPALERDHMAAYNCSGAAITGTGPTIEVWNDAMKSIGYDEPISLTLRTPIVFDELFYILLCGTGVGFSVERQFVNEMPTVGKALARDVYKRTQKNFPGVNKSDLSYFDKKQNTVYVADTKYGWASALRILIVELYNGNFTVKYDTHMVRPAGSPLKVFGGRASGSSALEKMFEDVRSKFVQAMGRKLTSEECHDVMCHIAEAVVVGGTRRCMPENTPVMTPNGFKFIRDIVVGDTIVTGGKIATVVAAECTGEKDLVKINHRFGTIECTPEHRVAVFNSFMKYEFKQAREVVEGDRLVWDSVGFDGSVTFLPPVVAGEHFNTKAILSPHIVTPDIAWLIGLVHGDGYIGDRSVEIAGNMKELPTLKRAAAIFEEVYGVAATCGSDGRPGVGARVRVSSSALADWFAEYVKKPNIPITIPAFIAEGTREIRWAYLAGILDADGRVRPKDKCIDQASTIYKSYADELVTMLAGLGVAAIVDKVDASRRRDNGEKAHDGYNVRVVGNTNRKFFVAGCGEYSQKLFGYEVEYNGAVDFSFPMRWNDTHTGYSANGNINVHAMRYDLPLLPTRVISVEKSGSAITYDIQVEDLEQFTANGLVVHNSALISLSNLSDDRMRHAKSGEWWNDNPQRALANNSVAYTEKPSIGAFMREWQALYESKSGERGVFNRVAVKNACVASGRSAAYNYVVNPCGEAILRETGGLCNLTEIVVRPTDSLEDLLEKAEVATILGTMQSTLTDFKYVNPAWKQNAEEERLLGVSMTGDLDHPILKSVSEESKKWLTELKKKVKEVNVEWAAFFGINQSAQLTLLKPSGTVSQLVDSASGMHPRYAPYYVRRVRADGKDPLAQVMMDQGYPCEQDVMNKTNLVFSFPVKAPEGAVFRDDRTAMEQLEYWLMWKQYWCDSGNPSVTIYVKEHEWLEVGAWVYKNFDEVCGISFLPHSDHIYQQAPYEECTKEKYEELASKLPSGIDYAMLNKLEVTDHTTGTQEYACVGGACEL